MVIYTENSIDQMETEVHVHFKFAHVLKFFNVLCDVCDRGLLTAV